MAMGAYEKTCARWGARLGAVVGLGFGIAAVCVTGTAAAVVVGALAASSILTGIVLLDRAPSPAREALFTGVPLADPRNRGQIDVLGATALIVGVVTPGYLLLDGAKALSVSGMPAVFTACLAGAACAGGGAFWGEKLGRHIGKRLDNRNGLKL